MLFNEHVSIIVTCLFNKNLGEFGVLRVVKLLCDLSCVQSYKLGFLPDPKMLSEGYWRSTLFNASSTLETKEEKNNQQ